MSKKPVPSKKQAVSSTRSRHAAYVRNQRKNLENKQVFDTCKNCGTKKRCHFACEKCGFYNGRQVFEPKTAGSAPTQEIEA